jgi:putative ABC transport system permease protein
MKMLKSYLKTALRHMGRNLSYTLISVFGLSIAVACYLLINLYVFDELSYDQFHNDTDKIYRVAETIDHNGVINAALSSLSVGPQMTEDYEEIESYVRFMRMGNRLTIKVEDNIYREENFWRTDSTLFSIFSFRLLYGNPLTALAAPYSIVLSKKLATKYFQSAEEAVGKQIFIGVSPYNVTGVVENQPGNSEITYAAFTSISSIPQQQMQALRTDWFRLAAYTFLKFNKPIKSKEYEKRFEGFVEKYVTPFVATFGGNSTASFHLQPLSGLHFDNSREYDLPKGNSSYLIIFITLAIFILLIACINFINLSLAQSAKRAKEVGLRKTFGADKGSIRTQFFGESFLMALISILFGLILAFVFLPVFNDISQKELTISEFFSLPVLLSIVGAILVIGFFSGGYPALVLSKFQPVTIMKGALPKLGGYHNLRKTLLVVQYAFSLFMIIGTIAIYLQLNFLQNKDLGFEKGGLMVLSIPQDTAVYNKLKFLKNDLLQEPGIMGVTGSGNIPGQRTGELMFRIEQDGEMIEKNIKFISADEDFFEILGIDLLEGRNFNKEISTDISQAFIVNQSAVERFGWTENPVEKRMQWGLMGNGQAANDGKVVGVVKDFHFLSLHNPLEPLAVIFRPNFSGLFSIKIAANQIEQNIKLVEEKWKQFAGNHPLEYIFLDERVSNQYQQERILLKIFGYFAILSLIVASIGLFALTSVFLQQREKEIGLRKILGATLSNITSLISKEFLWLILIAFLVTVPIAWYLLGYWLQDFSYKISTPYFGFIISGLVAVLISMITVWYHIQQAANFNPSKAIKYE